ncbi:hypothetical protein ANME2D_01918 [Candidatus Methanoperedens nitroreducens]|uniref:Uncharacterized protein n=1 Tax=Candidatus Methanoperedens nitratireducens TaxID=1392998 RepID=A0A062V5K3_9EURY|nr:DUF6516 family protein [Candidatus Methanoperedens nitroreducens]KCZ71863.1 hypothetical protein ANME2D_01918 [Candidatus Methanoperedens nitroreducens]MDJ1422162.1 DUF6516 family protein [Candidatus Methanoperedens sp.]
MRSREYYSQIETVIRDCPVVTHFSIDFDEIDEHIGYLKGRIELIDVSVLYFIEFVEIQDNMTNRLKYKYQWQSENDSLIARWDNVPHHKEVDTFPNHMHDDKGVHASPGVDLKTVIDIIVDKIII